ncbi:MAG: hypothetical protein WCF65_05850 [Parachlamydiaceae bacterium]
MITTGCGGPRYVDYFPYDDNGTPKPKVALIPLIDSSENDLSWDISEEISQGIYRTMMDSGLFYVPTPAEIGPAWKKIDQVDFFGASSSYQPLVNQFKNTDFVVVFDLIEHKISLSQDEVSPPKRITQCYAQNRQLVTRVRIKILDIRCEVPKIILFEVFKTCYSLTPSKYGFACDEIAWGSIGYTKTPCGIAHDRLIRGLAARLEQVIWSAK